jgi:hypothetical protein
VDTPDAHPVAAADELEDCAVPVFEEVAAGWLAVELAVLDAELPHAASVSAHSSAGAMESMRRRIGLQR